MREIDLEKSKSSAVVDKKLDLAAHGLTELGLGVTGAEMVCGFL